MKSRSAVLAIFAQIYVAFPLGLVILVSTAVMFWHVSEHSRSTTTLPSLPEDVPVTLLSVAMGMRSGAQHGLNNLQCMSEMVSLLGYCLQASAPVI